MNANQTVPDAISVRLQSHGNAIHVDQSDAYDSQADFVREALWDKLYENYQSGEVLKAFIAWHDERVGAVNTISNMLSANTNGK